MEPVRLPGYEEYFKSLNRHDQQRVLYLQWNLILEGFAAGLEFVALLCWHEAIDRAREHGIRARKNADDETPTHLKGASAKVFAGIDSDIIRNHCGSYEAEKPKAAPLKKLKIKAAKDDDYF